ncbi:hypothetical protein O6H91_01G108900 [Diphasiastrum complanatum]|uniref:Uncharacterized protein n=2 Tax=Diphasiastrum complanatum TaxID=34168 RepID=A0ACC2EUX2_DIPCM|nr:hypothetical protein O6H91_01G108900 [Diphasiastrum complanatum]KAJ7570175.1 hypothetical protein O6H91_01G108900 [Diphasiastrum complanatum]
MAALGIAGTPSVASSVSGNALLGQKLVAKPSRLSLPSLSSRKTGAVVAKYGEKSTYFDLEDIGNTTGSWDLYGSDGPSPYNGLQSKFFETFAGVFTKRGLLLKFLVLGGAGALGYAGSTVGGDILPIKKGPQSLPAPGPRGKI